MLATKAMRPSGVIATQHAAPCVSGTAALTTVGLGSSCAKGYDDTLLAPGAPPATDNPRTLPSIARKAPCAFSKPAMSPAPASLST